VGAWLCMVGRSVSTLRCRHFCVGHASLGLLSHAFPFSPSLPYPLPLSPSQARRARGMNYSSRRDQASLLRVPGPLSLPSPISSPRRLMAKRRREGEEAEEGEGGRRRRRESEEGGMEGKEGGDLVLLSEAEARLHLSSSPWTAASRAASLPCRERETQEVGGRRGSRGWKIQGCAGQAGKKATGL